MGHVKRNVTEGSVVKTDWDWLAGSGDEFYSSREEVVL